MNSRDNIFWTDFDLLLYYISKEENLILFDEASATQNVSSSSGYDKSNKQ